MFKDKKNIVILILSIVIIILIITGIIFFINSKNSNNTESNELENRDWSKLTSNELITKFQDEGYDFEITKFTDGNSIYIVLKNKVESITIQRIINTAIGTLMSYYNKSINNEMADIIDLSRNDTLEEQQQYKAFQGWLKYYNISKYQLSTMLDDYYELNKSSIQIIDVDALLNK